MAIGGVLAFAGSLLPLLTGSGPALVTMADALACAAALGMVILARRQIVGQTGDVAGAAQQAAEVTYLLMLCARV